MKLLLSYKKNLRTNSFFTSCWLMKDHLQLINEIPISHYSFLILSFITSLLNNLSPSILLSFASWVLELINRHFCSQLPSFPDCSLIFLQDLIRWEYTFLFSSFMWSHSIAWYLTFQEVGLMSLVQSNTFETGFWFWSSHQLDFVLPLWALPNLVSPNRVLSIVQHF